jgi:hypothetical protein
VALHSVKVIDFRQLLHVANQSHVIEHPYGITLRAPAIGIIGGITGFGVAALSPCPVNIRPYNDFTHGSAK